MSILFSSGSKSLSCCLWRDNLVVCDIYLGLLVESGEIYDVVINSPFIEGIRTTNIDRHNRTRFKEYRSINSHW